MNKSTHFSGQPIFSQILRLIPRGKVRDLARTHGSDHYYGTFKTCDHPVTMPYAVFNHYTSLREVITGVMAAHRQTGSARVGSRLTCSSRPTRLSRAWFA